LRLLYKPLEKKNKMDYETQLKEKEVSNLANLASIAGSLDDMRAEFQKDNETGYCREINNSIDSVACQLSELNKTMQDIAQSLRVIQYK